MTAARVDSVRLTEIDQAATGVDEARGKPTYPALLGISGARERATALHAAALAELAPFGPAADPLRSLAGFLTHRAA